MPDWTYQTVFRPTLFRLRPETGRNLALGAMGLLSRLPLGKHVIQLMGHMRPDRRLSFERNGLEFSTRVGLGCELDSQLKATPALAEFGFGYLEIGPVVRRASEPGPVELDVASETIQLAAPRAALTADVIRKRIEQDGPFAVPLFARIESDSTVEAAETCRELNPLVDGYFVPINKLDAIASAFDESPESMSDRPALLGVVEGPFGQDDQTLRRCVEAVRAGQIAGVVVAEESQPDGTRRLEPAAATDVLHRIRRLRAAVGSQPVVIDSVGIHSPADVLDAIEAGADLVQVASGLVFAGPGLPKRINEALLYLTMSSETQADADVDAQARWGGQSWFWTFLMGLSMLVGGLMATVIAATRVVMPYDEWASGLSREQLAQINDRLLPFMTHDRVTLAGTMLAVGILYVTLAVWGMRRGLHWAYVSVVVSALSGFISFFSFLGFGYFDPFHAFVTAILFQFLLLTMHSEMPNRHGMEAPDLWNDARWKANQWGQLAFVVHGAILIAAGVVISSVGMTSVFVPEDLEFMQTTAAELSGAHPQLVPLVAHDRATFGGMLIACGVATLLPALWGFRRGQAWLWWSLMLAGNVAYWATMLVHWKVGYDSLMHLLPAYGGLLLLWTGGGLSYRHLAARDRRLEDEWHRRLQITRS